MIVKSAGETLKIPIIKKGEAESWVLGQLQKISLQNGYLKMFCLLWIKQYTKDSKNISYIYMSTF